MTLFCYFFPTNFLSDPHLIFGSAASLKKKEEETCLFFFPVPRRFMVDRDSCYYPSAADVNVGCRIKSKHKKTDLRLLPTLHHLCAFSDESDLKMNSVDHIPQTVASHGRLPAEARPRSLWGGGGATQHGADMLKPDPRDTFYSSKSNRLPPPPFFFFILIFPACHFLISPMDCLAHSPPPPWLSV